MSRRRKTNAALRLQNLEVRNVLQRANVPKAVGKMRTAGGQRERKQLGDSQFNVRTQPKGCNDADSFFRYLARFEDPTPVGGGYGEIRWRVCRQAKP